MFNDNSLQDHVKKKIIPLVDLNHSDYNSRNTLNFDNVSIDYQWTYRSRNMNFNKDLNLKGRYCYHPFNTITIDGNGDVFMCTCQSWLPVSVGNILDFDSLADIVRSPNAREIQASIIDGTYRYCDDNTCSIIKENQLKGRISHRPDNINWINFSLDFSCNLLCPSCRNEFKFLKDGLEFQKRMKIVDHLIKLIESHNHNIKFSLAGDGDPFASNIYRNFLSHLDLTNKNDVEIEIITNGILLLDHWKNLQKIHKNIIRTKISFDAGSEEIYSLTRRGGNWDKLIKGVQYLKAWKDKNYSNMILTSNFVVQTTNYKDMIKYAQLCNDLGFDEINFQKIDNWGTFKNFNEHAVWKPEHPDYQEFLQCLRHPAMKNKKINLTNLSGITNEVE